jgi:hypothetical protein
MMISPASARGPHRRGYGWFLRRAMRPRRVPAQSGIADAYAHAAAAIAAEESPAGSIASSPSIPKAAHQAEAAPEGHATGGRPDDSADQGAAEKPWFAQVYVAPAPSCSCPSIATTRRPSRNPRHPPYPVTMMEKGRRASAKHEPAALERQPVRTMAFGAHRRSCHAARGIGLAVGSSHRDPLPAALYPKVKTTGIRPCMTR